MAALCTREYPYWVKSKGAQLGVLHIMLPDRSQGVRQAVEGAAVLAKLLRKDHIRSNTPRVLQIYEKVRKRKGN